MTDHGRICGKLPAENLYISLFTAERERRQALEEFRATLRGIGDGVIATDAEGQVRQMNPVAEELTGWSEAEAAGPSPQGSLPDRQ